MVSVDLYDVCLHQRLVMIQQPETGIIWTLIHSCIWHLERGESKTGIANQSTYMWLLHMAWLTDSIRLLIWWLRGKTTHMHRHTHMHTQKEVTLFFMRLAQKLFSITLVILYLWKQPWIFLESKGEVTGPHLLSRGVSDIWDTRLKSPEFASRTQIIFIFPQA